MRPDFRVHFNKGRQWVDVYVAESPAQFLRRNDCHAYYIGYDMRKKYHGLFGIIHLKKLDDTPEARELIDHEIEHLMFDWRRSRGITPSPRNEERMATLRGQVGKAFWRKYLSWNSA
jgi:hypothetical protein